MKMNDKLSQRIRFNWIWNSDVLDFGEVDLHDVHHAENVIMTRGGEVLDEIGEILFGHDRDRWEALRIEHENAMLADLAEECDDAGITIADPKNPLQNGHLRLHLTGGDAYVSKEFLQYLLTFFNEPAEDPGKLSTLVRKIDLVTATGAMSWFDLMYESGYQHGLAQRDREESDHRQLWLDDWNDDGTRPAFTPRDPGLLDHNEQTWHGYYGFSDGYFRRDRRKLHYV